MSTQNNDKDLKLNAENTAAAENNELAEIAAEVQAKSKEAEVKDERIVETKDERAKKAKKNKLKLRALAWVLIALIVLAAIPLNLLAESLGISWDMTPDKYYTLNETSHNVLSNLTEDITMYFLYDLEDVEADKDTLVLAKILRQYDEYEHLTLIDFDLSERPDLAQQANPDNNLILTEGDIVVAGNGLTKKVAGSTLFETSEITSALTFVGENSITGAIQYCLNGEIPTIYFMEGHDERDIEDDYASVVSLLQANSYAVKTLDITSSDTIPEDCKIIVIADPKTDISDDELKTLERYADDGGKICFLMAPNSEAVNYTNIEILLKQFGLGINYDKIEETGVENFASENPNNIKVDFADTLYTTLTDSFIDNDVDAYFPNTRSVYNVNTTNSSNLKVDLLIKALDDATAVTVPCGGIGKDVDEEYGVPYLAFSSMDNSRGDGIENAKVLLFGSADFIDDMYIESELVQEPMLLFFSGISWLYDNSVDMLIEDKIQKVDSFTIEDDSAADGLLIAIGAVPVCVAIIGFVVWARRRNS